MKTMRQTIHSQLLTVLMAVMVPGLAMAQLSPLRYGQKVSPEAEYLYERGLNYLVNTQGDDGSWPDGRGAAITGICLMAFLASGEDPNFGKYRTQIRRATRNMILNQDPKSGYLGDSMYHHGFGMLALAEVYGVLDDELLWAGEEGSENRRTLAKSLEMAVDLAVKAQQANRWGGWRYNPQSTDADTSVSGAVLMGLLAARNAGIKVPDQTIEKALAYFKQSTGPNGMVAYTGGIGGMGESMNRSAIATLVYSVGGKKNWVEYRETLRYITTNLEHDEKGHKHYFLYYMAQALFQGDFDAWERWNDLLIERLKQEQQEDGSFPGRQGTAYATGMSLLSLALNYRFLPIYER